MVAHFWIQCGAVAGDDRIDARLQRHMARHTLAVDLVAPFRERAAALDLVAGQAA